jgi:ethanolamine utilization protein EutA
MEEDQAMLADPELESGVKIEDVFGVEAFKQKSVGIDIGSSTSHLIFSELILRREGFSSKFRVTERRVLYESPILLTPYTSGTLIDAEALEKFVVDTYASAGVTPDEVDAGAILITGEALKKENAQPIVELFSKQVGKFICAAAGHHHESLLAAYGSGAVGFSTEHGWRILNVDMGGGTTKLALIAGGEVLETAAVSVGARLVAFDKEGIITRIEDPARVILGDDGANLQIGQKISEETKQKLTERMLDSLFELVRAENPSALTEALMVTDHLGRHTGLKDIDRVVFSGGVSEYVYTRDEVAYGDLGPLLGQGVRKRLEASNELGIVLSSPSGIRATVIGAGEYTIQASGVTSFISDREILPVYALKVVKTEHVPPDELPAAVTRALRKFDLTAYDEGLALSISLDETLVYPYLRKIAESIDAVVHTTPHPLSCLFLLIDRDVAKSIGSILKEELGVTYPIIALDSVELGDLDYIDIGKPLGVSDVLPVTVKSLVFPTRVDVQHVV